MPKSKEIISSEDDFSEDEQPKRKNKKDSKQASKKPKTEAKKPQKNEEEEDKDDEVHESESEAEPEEQVEKKNGKLEKSTKGAAASKKQKKDDEDEADNGMYMLAKMRFVNVSEFKGKAYVNIREYYEANGKTLPGKKGISLSIDQWENLKKFISKIDNDIKKCK